jgi:hypothetical protein
VTVKHGTLGPIIPSNRPVYIPTKHSWSMGLQSIKQGHFLCSKGQASERDCPLLY